MDSGLREREHLLALKVMRLTRPSLHMGVPVLCESQDLPGQTMAKAHEADIATVKGLERFAMGELLVLPQTFGNIFLGETFASYISVHNDSSHTAKDIVIKTDLQTSSQRISLSGTSNMPVPKLDPGESFDQVIHHEVKELGTHILVCAVSYATMTGEKMYFRKFFKFQVLKPLDVKTKFCDAELAALGVERTKIYINELRFKPEKDKEIEDNVVYLECQVQNITTSPVVMESVTLEPSPFYLVLDLNFKAVKGSKLQDTSEDSTPESIFGKGSYLSPNDTRQYLYKLTSKSSVGKNLRALATVGKLDIAWRSALGERGRLQTSQLQRVVPAATEIKLSVLELPDAVPVEKKFQVSLKLTNTSDRKMDLKLLISKGKDGELIWCGTSGKSLGTFLPGGFMDLELNLLPLAAGLQSIGGLRVMDLLSERTYEFDKVAQVFVFSSSESPFVPREA